MKILNTKREPVQLSFGWSDEVARLGDIEWFTQMLEETNKDCDFSITVSRTPIEQPNWLKDLLEDDFTLDQIEIHEGASKVFIGRSYDVCSGLCGLCESCNDEEFDEDPVETIWCHQVGEVVDIYEDDE